MITRLFLFLFLTCLAGELHAAEPAKPSSIQWQPWSEALFEKARREQRFVLLDLGAVWCHWCHVMDELTYGDPAVIELI
ncbi:MAG: DUF255 domain-containing protein, partial [Verrucomicrobiota bacterium]